MLRLTRLATTVFMLVLNTFAIILPLNGISTKELSDTLSTIITPAGFTFSIWSLIYLGLIGLTVAIMTKKIVLSDKIMIWYSVSALANGLRILAWHYENLHLSLLIMLVLLASLIMINHGIFDKPGTIHHFGFVKTVFLLYLGRIQIASALMILIYAQYQWGFFRSYEVLAGVVALCLLCLSNLFILYKEKSTITSLVALRALYGIYSGQVNSTIILVSQILIAILILAIGGHIWKYYLRR